MRSVLAAVAITCLAATATATLRSASSTADTPLPKGFEGYWLANLSTPVGPVHNVPMTVLPLKDSDGTRWLIRHDFARLEAVRSSQQAFWVTSAGIGDAATSNLTYCGALVNFFNLPSTDPGLVYVTFQQTARNASHIAWTWSDANGTAVAHWSFQLSADGESLSSTMMMPAGNAVHATGTYKRVRAEQLAYVAKDSDMPIPSARDVHPMAPPCNFTFAKKKNTDAIPAAVRNAASKTRGRGCPLGFGSMFGGDSESTAAKPATRSTPRQHCYVLNAVMNYTLAWDWDTASQTVAVDISTTFSSAAEAETSYVALGLYPDWPLMQGMDVVMGYVPTAGGGAPCVESRYAAVAFGTPELNPSQNISDTALTRRGATVTVSFTRPWNTGHVDLTNPSRFPGFPVVAFATGRAAEQCGGHPHYHFMSRGVYGMLFSAPEAVLPDYMRCPGY